MKKWPDPNETAHKEYRGKTRSAKTRSEMKQWKLIVAIVVAVSGGFTFLYTTFARNSDLATHVAEYKEGQIQDLIDKAQDRVFYWEDVTRKYPNDPKAKRELEKAKKKLKQLEDRLPKKVA